MLVNYVIGEKASEIFGQSRYQRMIYEQLRDKIDFNVIGYRSLKISLFSLIPKHIVYPGTIKRKIQDGVIHIASQEQAHVLNHISSEKSVATVLDVNSLYVLKNKNVRKKYGMFNYLLHRLDVPTWISGLKKANRIMAISEFTKREIINNLNYPPEKIEVIPLGTDLDRYKPLHTFRKPRYFKDTTILYVGTEDFRKNVPTLLKAFYKLKKILPGVKLVKVGKSRSKQGRKELLKLIDQLNLKDDITFVESVPEKDLPLFYNAADLVVQPLIYDGWCLPAAEAMACGTPVVISDAQVSKEIVGDAAVIFNKFNTRHLAKAMYQVLTEDGLRNKLIKKGLRRAKMFSWEKTAKKTLKVYKEVYGEK